MLVLINPDWLLNPMAETSNRKDNNYNVLQITYIYAKFILFSKKIKLINYETWFWLLFNLLQSILHLTARAEMK